MKIIFLLVLVSFFILPAFAEQYGIDLSPTCQKMLKHNISGCPTPDQILAVFPDNTDPRLGKLVEKDGLLQRDTPILKHPEKFYMYSSKDITWYNPPQDVRKNIKMVIIESSLPEYKLGEQSTKMNDYNISFGKDRYINTNCSEIKITSKNWLFMLGDAMNLLKHNCDLSYSTFNHIITIEKQKTWQDISTSYKYKLDNWIKVNMEKCKIKGCK